MEEIVKEAKEGLEQRKQAEQIGKEEEYIFKDVIADLEGYSRMQQREHLDFPAAFEKIREDFQEKTRKREREIEETQEALYHAFEFMEEAFGESQEMVVFVTELNVNYYSIQFIKENGCDKYYQYNKGLLFDEQQEAISTELENLKQKMRLSE